MKEQSALSPQDSIICETQYDASSLIRYAQLVASKSCDSWGYRYDFFFRDGTVKTVPNEQFDPVLQNERIVVSGDGKHLLVPNYNSGIVQKSILTGKVECLYPVRHIFDVLCISENLFCLQRETNRRLVRFEIGNPHPAEETKADGIKLFAIHTGIILYKKNAYCYALSKADSLITQKLLRISEIFGTSDPAFRIASAKYLAGEMDVTYYVSDPEKRGRLVQKSGTFALPASVQSFIEETAI